ncbi:sugar phosphate isomerase/epimerase family protein [Paenibacillus ehimensis]|uniref:sugar phosphate isomerase/epimerase family protein n=1 Tax=Paenibacillus ehimensis TaxID=79264 RepID=UPI002DB9374D|nr:sugar phosphate isomerase/epimerase family protein [Paenibacillus ehimensis]MEC0211307.1 sugar phosphate isomerase/epimerase [Paenibacillus ehimensis]
MKLSLSMWSLHRTVRANSWTVMDFLSFCRKEGIDSVELLNVFWQNQDRELDEVVRYCRENGIRVASYAVGNDFVSESEERRSAALREITDAFSVAKALGTSLVRVFSGSLHPGIDYGQALGWIVSGLSEAAKRAEAAGITLALENHGQLAGRGGQVKDILEQVGSKALRSTFDTGNFLLVDEHPSQAIEPLLPYIAHVHVKDFKRHPEGRYTSLGGQTFEGTVAGEGDTHLASLIERLEASGYAGAYVLEYEGTGDEAEGVRGSYAFVDEYNRTHGEERP